MEDILTPSPPPAPTAPPQAYKDDEHLRLLSIFHYAVAGLIALLGCIPFIHVTIGIVFIVAPESMDGGTEEMPPFFGWMFVIIGSVCILLAWTLAIFVFVAGRRLSGRRNRIFCMVIAGVLCAWLPLGTVLGVFTLMVLMRDSVRAKFEGGSTSIRTAY